MITYRATLRPRSATRSPWQADTLFGHLCWLIRYEQGEPALHALLDRYRQNEPPLLFSDGFPGDWLPRPLLPHPAADPGAKAQRIAAMRAAKQEQGVRWVSLDEFAALRRGTLLPVGSHPAIREQRTVLKNQINRLTGGTTPVDEQGGGNLYNVAELAFVDTSGAEPAGLDVSLYVRAADETWAERAAGWLGRLAQGGYGAKKSAGYGHFTVERWEPFPELDAAPADANGFISLSNWVPARGDPREGFYTTLVKYGKLGEEFANGANPFKFPLIMLVAGSSFYADAPLRPWYGRLVDRIAPANERVVQYGYAFAVPAHLLPDPSATHQ